MTITTPSGFESPSDDTVIWRYLSFERFKQLVETSSLYLPRIDYFSDFNEGGLTRKMKREIDAEMAAQGAPELGGVLPWFNQFGSQRVWYASCWNSSDTESNLMWRAYGTPAVDDQYQFKVAIKTTVGRLKSSLNDLDDLHLAKVSYLDFDNETYADRFGDHDGIPFDRSVFVKDFPYKPEDEIRLAYCETGSYFDSGNLADLPDTPIGKVIEIDLSTLLGEIYIEALPLDHKRLKIKSNEDPASVISYQNSFNIERVCRFKAVETLIKGAGVAPDLIVSNVF